jgi:hypothetical protein
VFPERYELVCYLEALQASCSQYVSSASGRKAKRLVTAKQSRTGDYCFVYAAVLTGRPLYLRVQGGKVSVAGVFSLCLKLLS